MNLNEEYIFIKTNINNVIDNKINIIQNNMYEIFYDEIIKDYFIKNNNHKDGDIFIKTKVYGIKKDNKILVLKNKTIVFDLNNKLWSTKEYEKYFGTYYKYEE